MQLAELWNDAGPTGKLVEVLTGKVVNRFGRVVMREAAAAGIAATANRWKMPVRLVPTDWRPARRTKLAGPPLWEPVRAARPAPVALPAALPDAPTDRRSAYQQRRAQMAALDAAGRSRAEIARVLTLPVKTVAYDLKRLRREGVLPPAGAGERPGAGR